MWYFFRKNGIDVIQWPLAAGPQPLLPQRYALDLQQVPPRNRHSPAPVQELRLAKKLRNRGESAFAGLRLGVSARASDLENVLVVGFQDVA